MRPTGFVVKIAQEMDASFGFRGKKSQMPKPPSPEYQDV